MLLPIYLYYYEHFTFLLFPGETSIGSVPFRSSFLLESHTCLSTLLKIIQRSLKDFVDDLYFSLMYFLIFQCFLADPKQETIKSDELISQLLQVLLLLLMLGK